MAAPKRFAVPSPDEDSAPAPIHLFPYRHSETVTQNTEQRAEYREESIVPAVACPFCLQVRCITSSAFKPQGRGNARITNHTKRRKDYKWYWRTLKACGLWENPVYLAHKQQLGCLIDDVSEVMPNCVVKDVRDRWPNPSGVPYQGHCRS